MRKFIMAMGLAFGMVDFASGVQAQQTAFNENNQNRAIGIARGELVDCLSRAYQETSYDIDAQARGELDANGELTGNWTVAFLNLNGCAWNGSYCEPSVIGFVRIENWEVVYSECRLRFR